MADIPKPEKVEKVLPPSPEVPKVESKVIAVQAIEKGFYDNSRKNPGDKFNIKSEKDFSKNWMIKL
jgi:hypothetical protein